MMLEQYGNIQKISMDLKKMAINNLNNFRYLKEFYEILRDILWNFKRF